MNILEFYQLRTSCIKCKSNLERSVQVSVSGFPFQYTLTNLDISKDYGSSDIVFNLSDKPPQNMNFRHGYLAKGDTDEPFEAKDTYVVLRALCKGCGNYSYLSTPEIIENSTDSLSFKFSHERYTVPGEFILVCNVVHNRTYLYISMSPIQRFVLEYKPAEEWLVDGDENFIRGKISKLKLLL